MPQSEVSSDSTPASPAVSAPPTFSFPVRPLLRVGGGGDNDADDNDDSAPVVCVTPDSSSHTQHCHAHAGRAVAFVDNTKRNKKDHSVAVHFGDMITVHSHAITLGDNPSVSCGPPITLEWECQETQHYALTVYELARHRHRRTLEQMRIPPCYRVAVLTRAGVSQHEITSAILQIQQLRQQRMRLHEHIFGGNSSTHSSSSIITTTKMDIDHPSEEEEMEDAANALFEAKKRLQRRKNLEKKKKKSWAWFTSLPPPLSKKPRTASSSSPNHSQHSCCN